MPPRSGQTHLKHITFRVGARIGVALLSASVALVLVARVSPAYAVDAPPSNAPSLAPTESPIPVAQIAERAERTDNLVRSIRARLAPGEKITAIGTNLPALAKQIEELHRDSVGQLAAGLTPQALDDLRRQWLLIKDQLTNWNQVIGARTITIEQDSTTLSELDDTWSKTEEGARENEFPPALREPIRAARESIHDTQTALRAQRDTLLAFLGRISSQQSEVSEAFAQLDMAEQQMRRDLLTADAAPLWRAPLDFARTEPVAAVVRTGLERNRNLMQAFLRQQLHPLALHSIMLVLFLIATFTLSRRVRDTGAPDDFSPAIRAVLTRPISAALVLAALLGVALHPYAPIFVASLTGVLAILPMMRLFRGPSAPQVRLSLLLLALLLLASTLRRFLPPFLPVARYMLLAESIAAMVSTFLILHPARLATLELADLWRRALTLARWAILVLITVSVIANVVGNVTLAILLTDGVLGAALAAIAFLAASRVVEALITQAIRLESAQRLHSIARHSRPLRRRTLRIVRLLMVLLWASITLKLFGLFTSGLESVTDVLAARLTIGAVSLSLADILTVVLTLWVSFFIAHIVRVVLEEDALPRLSLPRGVPAAISVGVNYVILLIGCVFALSAAGVDPGRVTLIAGALGVGIGFGLQTIVNNFVSGIILLFERPIQIGDIISFGNINGQVRRIGFRSSTIATFDGAEVVVPNGTLVSEQVINWTLSNYQRRIEIQVGIAYGNDPTAVIGVLEAAVKGNPDLLEQPAPRALFASFGESSLNFTLWVWTDHQDRLGSIRSAVAIAVYDALRAAGMEIPFPQQELHVKSVAMTAPPPSDAAKGG